MEISGEGGPLLPHQNQAGTNPWASLCLLPSGEGAAVPAGTGVANAEERAGLLRGALTQPPQGCWPCALLARG